jgi:hypothetical protein
MEWEQDQEEAEPFQQERFFPCFIRVNPWLNPVFGSDQPIAGEKGDWD